MKYERSKLLLKRVNTPHEKHKTFPVEKRIEVVTKYLAIGNMRIVAEATGVSYQLCRMWKQQPWWKELEHEIRAARTLQTDNKLSKIVDRALEAVSDRIENGDFRVDFKSGEVSRVPVSLRDATKTASDLLQRQRDLAKMQSEETVVQAQQSVQDQLAMLAGEFAKFNKGRTINVQAKDVTDALHEERETGLQAGEREVQFSPGERGEAGSAESGSFGDGEEGFGEEGGWEGCGPQDSPEQGGIERLEESESGAFQPESIFFTKQG